MPGYRRSRSLRSNQCLSDCVGGLSIPLHAADLVLVEQPDHTGAKVQGGRVLETLAKDVDVSAHSLWGWVARRRSPEPENIRKLADVLEERSKKLATIAEQLRRAAKTRL